MKLPTTRHSAVRLINELVHFGEETFFGYAGSATRSAIERVRTAHYWYFWWD